MVCQHTYTAQHLTTQEGEGWQQLPKKIQSRMQDNHGKADDISRAVLRSQPPHAADVPDMVAYIMKYGTGPFIDDLLAFARVMNIHPSVHVPGRIFAAAAKVTFGSEHVPFAINAIMKRVAASTVVIDGICNDIKATEIQSLHKRTKDMVLINNMIKGLCLSSPPSSYAK